MTVQEAAEAAEEAELWNRYARGGDNAARDDLFARYSPWAAMVARSVHRRVRAYAVDGEDFVQNAKMGLLEAISRYDPGRGVAFAAFARPRVRGAVFNGLKAIMADRPARQHESYLQARLESLQSVDDVASDAFDAVVDSIVDLGLGLLLDEGAHRHDAASSEGYAYARASEFQARLGMALERLPARHAMIIRAHYFQHVQFQELAARLGLTKGRISQLHGNALKRLRNLLHDLR